jgi:hypothetical protein
MYAFIHYFEISPAFITTAHAMSFIIVNSEMTQKRLFLAFTERTTQMVKSPFGMTKRTDQDTLAVITGQPGYRRFRTAHGALAMLPGVGSNQIPIKSGSILKKGDETICNKKCSFIAGSPFSDTAQECDLNVHLEERLNIEVFKSRTRRHLKTHSVRKEGGEFFFPFELMG